MNNKVGIKKFYEERFSGVENTAEWFSAYASDISLIAERVQIDWDKCRQSNIEAGRKWSGKDVAITDSRHRHFLELFWHKTKGGIVYPKIQFFSHKDGTQWWNGYESLLEDFERSGQSLLDDIQRDKLLQRKLAAERKAKAKKERADKLSRLHDKHQAKSRLIYQRRWERGDHNLANVADHPYLIKKGIPAAVLKSGQTSVTGLGICRVIDAPEKITLKNGAAKGSKKRVFNSWLAIPMFGLMGQYVGQQRIYDNGGKFHARGSIMSEAHFVIGDITEADQIEYVEGFATGASIYKTAITENRDCGFAVVVCFDKNGLGRIVKHYQQKWKAKTHIVRADNDHFKWLEGKGNSGLIKALELQKELGIRCSYPDFAGLPCDSQPTDFNDLEQIAGAAYTAKQLWSREQHRLTADKNLFDYHLQLLKLSGQNTWKGYAQKAAQFGAFFIPEKLDRQTVLRAIFDAIPNPIKVADGDKKRIARHLSWLVNRRFNDAAATKNFSDDVLKQDNVNHIVVDAEISEGGYPVIPTHVLDMVKALPGGVILKAQHGTGKTERVMGPLMRDCEGGAAMVVHRVTLANQMATELNLRHYKDLDAITIGWSTRFVTCVNSIVQEKFNGFFEQSELLCVDEATQNIRHVFGGDDAIHAPVRAYNKMLMAARSAQKVLLADADANDSLVEFLEQARPGQAINIIEVKAPAPVMQVNYTDNVNFVFHKILEAAGQENKKRILVATDSKNKAEAVAEGIRTVWPAARVLCVTSDSKGDTEQLRFSNDPNNVAKEYDVLIYSPVISSGVSIKDVAAKFDRHFGLFHGVVVPSDILQMMRRDRNATEFLVGFRPNHEKRLTDRDSMVRGLMSAHQMSASKLKWTETENDIAIEKTPFDEMFLSVRIAENKARNDYANHTLMLMAAEGWKISQIVADETEAACGGMEYTASKEAVTEQRHSLIMNVQTPEENEAHRMRRKELITQAEAAQLVRFDIENKLGVEVSAKTIEFYDDRGLSRIRRLELVNATQEQVGQIDHWENDKKVVWTQRRNTLAKWTDLTRVFDLLGVDPKTGEGCFDVSAAKKVVAYFTNTQEAMDRYNALKIGPQLLTKPSCPTRFVKGILERFCPIVNAKKVRGVQFYQLHPEKFGELAHYINTRQSIGQNAYVIDTTAEYGDDNHTESASLKIAQAPSLLGCSEGGETIQEYINTNSGISPREKSLLVGLIHWLTPRKNSNQITNEMPLPMLKLQATGRLTIENLMRLARGWLDPRCEDATWGDVQPMLVAEV